MGYPCPQPDCNLFARCATLQVNPSVCGFLRRSGVGLPLGFLVAGDLWGDAAVGIAGGEKGYSDAVRHFRGEERLVSAGFGTL